MVANLRRLIIYFFQALIIKAHLRIAKKTVMAFSIPSLGEFQFIEPIILEYARRNPEATIILIHQNDTIKAFKTISPLIAQRALHIHRIVFEFIPFPEINLFLTSEQYDLGLNGIYSITTCHGQAAKGLSFVPGVIDTFDALFLNGPIHREAFDLFVDDFLNGIPPSHMQLFEIGYPKSDRLLNNLYPKEVIVQELRLDTSKTTVLYAPAFNEGASLRECGLEVIELLAQQDKYNIIVKLPIDCWNPTSNLYATGGVNWFKKIRELEAIFPNLHLFSEYQIDPLLACADVLITCISSVSFEFFALNKPVLFIDTPKYFSDYLKQRFPDKDTVSWANRTTVNGGKEFGLVVKNIHDIPAAIETVLAHPDQYPRQQQRLQKYLLYNRGHATETAVKIIEELLIKRVKSRRPNTRRGLALTLLFGLLRRLFRVVWPIAKKPVLRFLHRHGYTIKKTGGGYIDAFQTVAAAKRRGLSVCEYLESNEADPRKHGRRNRIVAMIQTAGIFQHVHQVCEIGAGTGQYLEKIIELAHPAVYEVYETNQGWLNFLKTKYNGLNGCVLLCHPADGHTLSYTANNTCDIVHAHGVFVYLPLLQSMSYLKECVRVCRHGGYIVFDYYPSEAFTLPVVNAWLASPHRFPVVIPRSLLEQFAQDNCLRVVKDFPIIHGASQVEYIIWHKASSE